MQARCMLNSQTRISNRFEPDQEPYMSKFTPENALPMAILRRDDRTARHLLHSKDDLHEDHLCPG